MDRLTLEYRYPACRRATVYVDREGAGSGLRTWYLLAQLPVHSAQRDVGIDLTSIRTRQGGQMLPIASHLRSLKANGGAAGPTIPGKQVLHALGDRPPSSIGYIAPLITPVTMYETVAPRGDATGAPLTSNQA